MLPVDVLCLKHAVSARLVVAATMELRAPTCSLCLTSLMTFCALSLWACKRSTLERFEALLSRQVQRGEACFCILFFSCTHCFFSHVVLLGFCVKSSGHYSGWGRGLRGMAPVGRIIKDKSQRETNQGNVRRKMRLSFILGICSSSESLHSCLRLLDAPLTPALYLVNPISVS